MLLFKGYCSEIPYALIAMHTAFDKPAVGLNAVPHLSGTTSGLTWLRLPDTITKCRTCPFDPGGGPHATDCVL